MADILGFDKINKPTETSQKKNKEKSIPYERYFGEMDLTDEQIEERTQFAYGFEDIMLFIFGAIVAMKQSGNIDKIYLVNYLSDKYTDLIDKYYPDAILISYVLDFASDIIDTTVKHIDDVYYTSNDRARYVAENEANTVANNAEYNIALRGGRKKQWVSMKDRNVRPTHMEVDDKIIDITEPFKVGDSLMMYPKDVTLGADASEIVNCRCTINYL